MALTFDPLGNGGTGLLYAANTGDSSIEGFNSLGIKTFDSGFVPGGIDGVGNKSRADYEYRDDLIPTAQMASVGAKLRGGNK